MRQRMDEATEKYHLNFSLIATPAEGLSGRFVKIDREKYGMIPGVTDRDYYTNSFHVPVYYPISAFEKIAREAPYHELTNGGHISYIELDGDPTQNLEAFEAVVRAMKEAGIGYGAINHPIDRDPVCGYTCTTVQLCCGVEEDPALRLRRREHELYMTAAMAERECAVAGEVTVPAGQPAPEDLLLCRLYPQVASCQLVGAKLLVKGELTLCALYRCQQQKLHTYTAAVPFSQIVDSPAGGEEGDVAARVQLICGEARLLRTEESSGFSVSAELRLLLRITRKETVSCVTDLYSTHCGTKLETTERSLPLAPERPVRQEAVQHLDFGRQRPFVFVTDTACAPSAGEDGTPCADVRMRLLYLDEEEAPAVTEKMAQLPLGEGEICTLCGAPEVAFTGSGCDLRQAVAVSPAAAPRETLSTVSAVQCLPEQENARRPSLVMRRLAPGETLWDAAKQYRTDEELIRAVNQLEEGTVPDKMLLIPRVR